MELIYPYHDFQHSKHSLTSQIHTPACQEENKGTEKQCILKKRMLSHVCIVHCSVEWVDYLILTPSTNNGCGKTISNFTYSCTHLQIATIPHWQLSSEKMKATEKNQNYRDSKSHHKFFFWCWLSYAKHLQHHSCKLYQGHPQSVRVFHHSPKTQQSLSLQQRSSLYQNCPRQKDAFPLSHTIIIIKNKNQKRRSIYINQCQHYWAIQIDHGTPKHNWLKSCRYTMYV